MDSKLDLNLHPRQWEAFNSKATEILYGGASRGGKSVFARFLAIILCTQVPGLQCFLFRKYYQDVISNHMDGPLGFRNVLANWVKDGLIRITETEIRWPKTGSLISLNACAHDDDLEKHQGIEKHLLIVDEAPQIKERHLRWLRAWVSMPADMKAKLPAELKDKLPLILYTGNPIGASAGFFRRYFVKARPEFAIEPCDGFLRQYIPARLEDNPSEDAEAAKGRIRALGDDALAEALITGSWDAPIGDYFPQYDDSRHATPDFEPPEHWFKFRTFDWGASEPFCVHWWAVSDGEEFKDSQDRKRWFPRSSLVCYREWYGCDPKEPAKGLQMRNEDIAQGIITKTYEHTSGLTVTDSLPFQDRGMSRNGKKYLISDVFKEYGCPLTLGNTARINGWAQLRDRLIGRDGLPLIYFCESCRYVRDYLPALARHPNKPEDAEESGEATHACDSARLAATTRPLTYDAPEVCEPPDPSVSLSPQAILRKLNQVGSYARR